MGTKKLYKPLKLNYTEEGDIITFEDGVQYSRVESNFIAKAKLAPEEIRAVHLVKKVFGGDLEPVVRRRKLKRPLDILDAIRMKYGDLPLVNKKSNLELKRKIGEYIKRKNERLPEQMRLDI